MSEIAKVKLSLNEVGLGSVMLNDMDISSAVTSVEIKCGAGDLTEIKLTVFAVLDAEIMAKLESIALAKPEPKFEDGIRLLSGNILRRRPRA